MNEQIYREASEWLVELRVGDIDAPARERLDAWFRTSPQHIRAFLELSNIWEEGADKDLSRAFSTADIIARARAADTTVIPIGASAAPREEAQPQLRAVRPARGSVYRAAASVAFLALALSGWALYRYWLPTYTTGIGEQRTVALADGSRVELNARSSLRVRFTQGERDVELLAGQALFTVSKDARRPFVVTSDATRVRAVGTQFDVNRRSTGTTVTVLEGRVAILPLAFGKQDIPQPQGPETTERVAPPDLAFPGASAGILLSAGEQVTATAKQISKPKKTDTTAATAWTQRELVFDATPLSEVADEFNRYNEKPLLISDGALKDFHVTGIFSSTNPASLLKFLRAQKGIHIDETDRSIRISRQ